MIKKFTFLPVILLFSLFVTGTSYAVTQENSHGMKYKYKKPLDKVAMQLSAEQWASTQKPLVTIMVNASLANDDLASIQPEVMQNLSKLAPNTQWHITQFDRAQGQSGLEQVTISAQARVADNSLATIRSQAKAISKPGQKYDVSDIAYTPSLAEIEKTKQALREQIYNDAKAELARLNQVYPDQKFMLYRIRFLPYPLAKGQNARPQMMMAVRKTSADTAASGLSVSNKVVLNALVVFAAKQ